MTFEHLLVATALLGCCFLEGPIFTLHLTCGNHDADMGGTLRTHDGRWTFQPPNALSSGAPFAILNFTQHWVDRGTEPAERTFTFSGVAPMMHPWTEPPEGGGMLTFGLAWDPVSFKSTSNLMLVFLDCQCA